MTSSPDPSAPRMEQGKIPCRFGLDRTAALRYIVGMEGDMSKSSLSRTQRDYEAREDASRIAAGNLLEAARANERQARKYAGDDAHVGQRRACLSLARDQRHLLADRQATSGAAAALGRLGRGAAKRRDVDYAALGAKGGRAGKGTRKTRRAKK